MILRKKIARTNFIKVFFRFLLKKGNLRKSENIFKKIFNNLTYQTNLGEYSILLKIYQTLYINFEVRKIKKYRSTHLVVIPIKRNRQHFLIVKFLFDAIKEDKRHVSIATKLTSEILKHVKNEDSASTKLRVSAKDLAFKSRANAHYRWC